MDEVTVFWEDSKAFGNHWYSPEDIKDFEFETIRTRGFLVEENKRRVVVAQSLGESGDVCNLILIPRRCIVKIMKP
jgi:hypothetical protein